MNETFDEPTGLAARLLHVEPPDDERLKNLQREIAQVFNKPLTRAERVSSGVGLVVGLGFAASGVARVVLHWDDPVARANGSLLTVAMLASAWVSSTALRRGGTDARAKLAASKFLPAAALVATVLLLARAATHPSIPALAWGVFAAVWLLVSLAIVLYNRVVTGELSTREALLRLELRLADAGDRAGR